MTRTIPEGLAPVVERLELDQPRVVTLRKLTEIAQEAGLATSPRLIAQRMRQRGWLLPTGLRGVWEFAPASHAGPHSRGGPLLPIVAALALHPDLRTTVALSSAAWVHGLANRAPRQLEVAAVPGEHVPAGLRRRVKILTFSARIESIWQKSVPIQQFETLLVHLAARPTQVSSWGDVAEWLGDVVAEADEAKILSELVDRPRAVWARLAYLISGMWPELAERLAAGVTSKVWFGPRRKLRRHSQQWQVADSLLPFDPTKFPPVRSS